LKKVPNYDVNGALAILFDEMCPQTDAA